MKTRIIYIALLCAVSVAAQTSRPRNYPTNWWRDIQKQPDEWYRSEDGKRVATNILSWQDESGGWPLMTTINEPWTGDESAIAPWGRRGALIKATVNEIRFLARGFRATGDERYCAALLKGLEFILRAQYPSGGWPHSYPVFRNEYDRYATFNDDEIPDLMRLLREAAQSADFTSLTAEKRRQALEAFDRGVSFILKTQIVVGGKRTAWCQQYDEVTLQPRAARKFEPVAISGGESAGILLLLMSIEKPNPEIVAAVHAGAAWYEAVKVNGVRVELAAGDRIVREDKNAPPIWARFYEIETNRPIFAGRDGVIKYSLKEIEQERRGGYAWYGSWGLAVLAEYAKWSKRHPRG
jgi:pectate lyase